MNRAAEFPRAVPGGKRKTKRPEFDLPTTRGDRLTLLTAQDGVFRRKGRSKKANGPAVVDLFCGAGGMALGFAEAGFNVALGIDSDSLCAQTFAYNLSPTAVEEDVDRIQDPVGFIQEH